MGSRITSPSVLPKGSGYKRSRIQNSRRIVGKCGGLSLQTPELVLSPDRKKGPRDPESAACRALRLYEA